MKRLLDEEVCPSSHRQQATVKQMSPYELKEVVENPAALEEVQFVDVREGWEFEEANLPYFRLFPLSQASEW